MPRILLWDTGDPYYYLRLESPQGLGHDILMVGGPDHKTGHDDPWKELYDPARKPLHGLFDFASEQVRTVARYGLRKIAVYRDAQGGLHAVSAKCTHLGCAVHWNSAERSWDCPCHASRFDIEGDVLHGPAPEALEKVELQGNDAPPPRTPRAGMGGRNAR